MYVINANGLLPLYIMSIVKMMTCMLLMLTDYYYIIIMSIVKMMTSMLLMLTGYYYYYYEYR